MKNIRIFYLKIFIFLVLKFSVYLNRRVFLMRTDPDETARYELSHLFLYCLQRYMFRSARLRELIEGVSVHYRQSNTNGNYQRAVSEVHKKY